MRMPRAPWFLAPLVLGGWVTGAMAQVAPDAPSTVAAQAAASGNAGPGSIPQPTTDAPGFVLGVKLGELYTNNLELVPAGKPRQGSWITEVRPFVKAATRNAWFAGSLDYELTGYAYAGQSSHNQLAQALDARGTLVAVPAHLFVDGSVQYGREVVNGAQAYAPGAFFIDNNSANVARTQLSPYWVQGLGRWAQLMARLSWGRIDYSTRGIAGHSDELLQGIPDTTSKAAQLSLVGQSTGAWDWRFDYSDQRLDPDFGIATEYASAKLRVSRQVGVHMRLLLDAGKENRYLPDGTVNVLGASLWDVGFEWLGARDQLRLLVGHRFYGHSYDFSWSHTAALLTMQLGYVEQPTNLANQLLSGSAAQLPSLGYPVYGTLGNQQVYLMRRATASLTLQMPHGNLQLSAYNDRRDYFVLQRERERVTNADIAWRLDLSAKTTLTPGFGWQRYQHIDDSVQTLHYAQVTLLHQFNPDDFASLRLRKYEGGVQAGPDNGYAASVVFLEWTHLFRD